MKKPTSCSSTDGVTFKVSFQERPDFSGNTAAFLFDSAGHLLEATEVKNGQISFKQSEKEVGRSRLFISTLPDNLAEVEASIKVMQRLGAYEPVVRVSGQLVDTIQVPGIIIDHWPICFCWVQGRVIKSGSGHPICSARVHICEVDKVWRWLLTLPELEILRLRDDLIKVLRDPPITWPPRPQPDPSPFDIDTHERSTLNQQQDIYRLNNIDLNSQPAPPASLKNLSSSAMNALPVEAQMALTSPSAHIVRQALIDQARLITPYLCLWPWWWRFRCDEITVIETDTLGRFQAVVPYLCAGDKPDLYFWVEYEISGTLETIYRPLMACNTYWNYNCGSEVIININDDRVPACDDEPDLPGSQVQILSMGRNVSISDIQRANATTTNEGLTSDGRPFGGRLEPRIWFSRTALRDGKNIQYYRWSYRRLSEGDGTPLSSPGAWTPFTRTVVRHYAKPASTGGVTHEPYILGPVSVAAETNLFEIKPADVPPGGIEWTVVDEREDLASGYFVTTALGNGANACEKAFDAAGKYELKLELFKDNGDLVDWTAEEIDLNVTNLPAPFGAETVTASNATNYHRIKNGAGHTVAFRMVLRVDNNCCTAKVKPVSGVGLTTLPCGFIEYAAGARANLSFKAGHPNGFADLAFGVKRGASDHIPAASASGRVGLASIPSNDASHVYTLTLPNNYGESFLVTTLLGACDRAAFSEVLRVSAKATNGYSRLSNLDAFDHDAFALSKPCPPCECD